MRRTLKTLGWCATATIGVACVGSDPSSDSTTHPTAAPDAAVAAVADGSAPLGRCVFGTSHFGDLCKHGP
jgi:hypothetical protein